MITTTASWLPVMTYFAFAAAPMKSFTLSKKPEHSGL
jgi:hypothetical protein